MSETETTVDKSKERVRAMFGEIAPKYDLLNNLLSVGLAPRWRRKFVAEVFKRVSTTDAREIETLDVATGTGDVVLEERRQWTKREQREPQTPSLKTIGVDFTPQMLELAREKARGVEFIEADGCDLPFEDGRFDAVTISFGLRNMTDPGKGVAEMARVCRPGGVVAILEFSPTKFPIFAPIFRFYFHHILPAIGRRVARDKTDAYRYLPASVDAFDSRDVVLEHMRANGLTNASWRGMTFGVLGIFIGEKR